MGTPSIPPQLRTTEPETTPAPSARAPRTGYIQCDFCDCRLTQNGQVYELGEKAVAFRYDKEKHSKAVTKLDEEIATLRAQIVEKDREIASLRPSSSSPTSSSGIRIR